MRNRKDNQAIKKIKHSDVEYAIDQYLLAKKAKGEKPLSIEEVLAKMQGHVDAQSKSRKTNTKETTDGREL